MNTIEWERAVETVTGKPTEGTMGPVTEVPEEDIYRKNTKQYRLSFVAHKRRLDTILSTTLTNNTITIYDNFIGINVSHQMCLTIRKMATSSVFLGCRNIILGQKELNSIFRNGPGSTKNPDYQALYISTLTKDRTGDINQAYKLFKMGSTDFLNKHICIPYKQLLRVFFLRCDFTNWGVLVELVPIVTDTHVLPLQSYDPIQNSAIQKKLDHIDKCVHNLDSDPEESSDDDQYDDDEISIISRTTTDTEGEELGEESATDSRVGQSLSDDDSFVEEDGYIYNAKTDSTYTPGGDDDDSIDLYTFQSLKNIDIVNATGPLDIPEMILDNSPLSIEEIVDDNLRLTPRNILTYNDSVSTAGESNTETDIESNMESDISNTESTTTRGNKTDVTDNENASSDASSSETEESTATSGRNTPVNETDIVSKRDTDNEISSDASSSETEENTNTSGRNPPMNETYIISKRDENALSDASSSETDSTISNSEHFSEYDNTNDSSYDYSLPPTPGNTNNLPSTPGNTNSLPPTPGNTNNRTPSPFGINYGLSPAPRGSSTYYNPETEPISPASVENKETFYLDNSDPYSLNGGLPPTPGASLEEF